LGFSRLDPPVNAPFEEVVLKFFPGVKIIKVGRIEEFAFLLQVAMIAAYAGTNIVDGALMVITQILAGASELDMPFFVMIDKHVYALMRKVPPYVVEIVFGRRPVNLDRRVLAAPAPALQTGRNV